MDRGGMMGKERWSLGRFGVSKWPKAIYEHGFAHHVTSWRDSLKAQFVLDFPENSPYLPSSTRTDTDMICL